MSSPPQSSPVADLSTIYEDECSSTPPGIKITSRTYVCSIKHITVVPEVWPIPVAESESVAYILDLRENTPECMLKDGKTIDAFIKQQCQDSWRGTTGSKASGKTVTVSVLNPLLGVECRRSMLYCNGCYVCNFSALDFLNGYERWDSDEGEQGCKNLVNAIQEAREREAASVTAKTISWYRTIRHDVCERQLPEGTLCDGVPVVCKFYGQNHSGSSWFIGCSKGGKVKNSQSTSHYFRSIPSGIQVNILRKLFNNEALYDCGRPASISDDIKSFFADCKFIAHPSVASHMKECPHTHFAAGRHEIGHFFRHECHAKMTIFVPVEDDDFRAVIIPEACKPHSHPIFQPWKVPHAASEMYRQCVQAVGILGATTLKVDKAASTREILGGKMPQELHDSLINNRKRHKIIFEERKKTFLRGPGLEGVWHQYLKERDLPVSNRYIHGVHTFGQDSHIVITIHPDLTPFITNAQWIMVDTTFKVVHGETNEFKVVIWVNSLNQRLVAGRIWTNSATREAYLYMWNGLFEAVKLITGKELNFKIFSPQSSLLGIIGDAEAAQAQAFGDMVLSRHLNNPVQSGLTLSTSDDVLLHLWKTCTVHFDCSVFGLESHVPNEIIQVLRLFPYLESNEDISQYMNYCEELSLSNKKVRDWFNHKKRYPWLLPSFNRCLSKMRSDHWDLLLSNTNQIEGSHANDNKVMSVNHTLLEAILLARKTDDETARIMKLSLKSGILPNPYNSLQHRYTSQNRRKASSQLKHARANAVKEEKLSIKAHIKQLQGKLRQLEGPVRGIRNHASSSKSDFTAPAKPTLTSSIPIYTGYPLAEMSAPEEIPQSQLTDGISASANIPLSDPGMSYTDKDCMAHSYLPGIEQFYC